MNRRLFVGALMGAYFAGCSAIFGVDVPEQTLTAACGMCVFGQPSPAGCYWAIEYEGSYYAVNGPLPKDHEAHGQDGMCTRPRKAVVAGTIRGEQIFASRFDLLPPEPLAEPFVPPKPAHVHGAAR